MDMRSVAGFPGYFVSDDGRLWSTKGPSNQFRKHDAPLHELGSTSVAGHGYRSVRMRDASGVYRSHCIHELVAIAFLGPRPEGSEEIRHLDGDKLNNSASNLRWGTRRDNAADREAHGTHRHGSAHSNAKLNEALVVDIRRRIRAGERQKDIAKELGVNHATLSTANSGRTWAHVQEAS